MPNNDPKTLYVVVPCYNEQDALPITNEKLLRKLSELIACGEISGDSRIMYVDDGSKDDTWQIIRNLNEETPRVAGVKLSRNRGHQNALLAGLMAAKDKADCVISMDADLQDDIGAVDKMISEFKLGSDVVYGVRNSRDTDTAFKRNSAGAFYKLMRKMGVDIVDNHADYRLLSKRALDALSEYNETNLFLRAMIPQLGYKSAIVTYERSERVAGESKYPLKKMLNFAWDGITSFSAKPIRIIAVAGAVISALSLIWLIVSAILSAGAILPSIWLIGGIQLAAIGVVGEYVGKAYIETKSRPKYFIEQILE